MLSNGTIEEAPGTATRLLPYLLQTQQLPKSGQVDESITRRFRWPSKNLRGQAIIIPSSLEYTGQENPVFLSRETKEKDRPEQIEYSMVPIKGQDKQPIQEGQESKASITDVPVKKVDETEMKKAEWEWHHQQDLVENEVVDQGPCVGASVTVSQELPNIDGNKVTRPGHTKPTVHRPQESERQDTLPDQYLPKSEGKIKLITLTEDHLYGSTTNTVQVGRIDQGPEQADDRCSPDLACQVRIQPVEN